MCSAFGMSLHYLIFLIVKPLRLIEYPVGNTELADIMHKCYMIEFIYLILGISPLFLQFFGYKPCIICNSE